MQARLHNFIIFSVLQSCCDLTGARYMHDSNSNFIANCILDCIAIANCILIALRFNYGLYLFQPVCLGFL